MALGSKLRQIESEKEVLPEQLDEDEETKKINKKMLSELNFNFQDMKKGSEKDSDLAKVLETFKKKMNKDLDTHQRPGAAGLRSARQAQKEDSIGAGGGHDRAGDATHL